MVKKTIGKINSDDLWEIIAKNYEFIEGAQMSNSFIILMALNQKNHKHNSNIRKIAINSKGQLYKVSEAAAEPSSVPRGSTLLANKYPIRLFLISVFSFYYISEF